MADSLFCPVRRQWVAASPDECVRQSLIHQMIHQLGYPSGYIVLEKNLRQMPHLIHREQKLPTRRTDLVVFSNNIHSNFPLYPLLLIECKVNSSIPRAFEQALGYNCHLGAYYVAVATTHTIQWCKARHPAIKQSGPHLPFYTSFLNDLKSSLD